MKKEYEARARSDEALRPIVKRALAGDISAYEELVTSYEKLVYNLCLRYAECGHDAEDLTQDIFLKMWRSLPGFKWESSFNTWMYRIVKNSCLDYIRKNSKGQTVSLSYEDIEDGSDRESELPDTKPLPDEVLESEERIRMLYEAMDKLHPAQREIIVLRDIEGYSYAQITDMLGLEEGTVKSRLHRARAILKDMLEEMNFS